MIDRTQLTDALAAWEANPKWETEPIYEAARLLLDFPTTQQVEAGAAAADVTIGEARVVLETVRDTMIADG